MQTADKTSAVCIYDGCANQYRLQREKPGGVTSRGFSIRKQIGLLDDVEFAQSHGEPQHGNYGLLRYQSPQQGIEKKQQSIDGVQAFQMEPRDLVVGKRGTARIRPLKTFAIDSNG
jgi:hypothetical protein